MHPETRRSPWRLLRETQLLLNRKETEKSLKKEVKDEVSRNTSHHRKRHSVSQLGFFVLLWLKKDPNEGGSCSQAVHAYSYRKCCLGGCLPAVKIVAIGTTPRPPEFWL